MAVVDKPTRRHHEPGESPHRPGSKGTILLVEDEEVFRRLVTIILVWEGYTVLEARNGEEALELSRVFDRPIHLLVTDPSIPLPDGGELLRRLLQTRPGIRAMMMSARDREDVPWDPGISRLEKPFTRSFLLSEVARAIA